MTESDLIAALRQRYAAPEFAFIAAVRNGTGWQRQTRTADAIAMSLWPSRGLELHGFEIKVSRGDWRREKRDPAKAEEIQAFMDRWWLVAPLDVVPVEEVPPTWGLLEFNGAKWRTVREAPKLDPQPITRLFLAAMLRRAAEDKPTNEEADAKIVAAAKQMEERLTARVEEARKTGRIEAETERGIRRQFEEASGIKIDGWRAGKVGAAVRIVLDSVGQPEIVRALQDIAVKATRIAENAKEAAAEFAALKR